MKKLINQLIAIAAASAFAMPASAVVFGDGGVALQGVLDGITTNPAGNSSVNVATDEVNDAADSHWQIGGSGGSVTTLIIEIANFASTNTFGIYDRANSGSQVQIFGGAATTGSQTVVNILADGSVFVGFVDTGIDFAGNNFGFYLDSTADQSGRGGLFFSDTSLNSDSTDHMAAYQGVGDEIQILPFAAGPWGPNEYILAWEDLDCTNGINADWPNNPGTCDADFTDFVVLVESVSPAPEPMIMSLLGLGLAGIGFASRRRRQV